MPSQAAKLTDFDDYLKESLVDKERTKCYLNSAIEKGDYNLLKQRILLVVLANGGVTLFAKKLKISRQAIHQSLKSDSRPDFAKMVNILKAIGFSIRV